MITRDIQAVLFAAAKPIKLTALAKHLEVSEEVVNEAIEELKKRLDQPDSGIRLLEQNGLVSLITNPESATAVTKFIKHEAAGPLTRASLETLTIVAYRGPITKPEIELIRGVNCSLILRNLLIRGYVIERMDKERLQPVYTLSAEFMQKLGITSVDDLPDFEAFATNEKITELCSSDSSLS